MRVITAKICASLALLLVMRAPAVAYNDPLRVGGYLGGFWTRNYLGPVPMEAPVWGEDLLVNLTGSILDRRVMRYTLGVDLLDGRTFGVGVPATLLRTGAHAGLRFLPMSWHQFGLYGNFDRLRVYDGPTYALVANERLVGADVLVRAPSPWVPQAYTRFEEGRLSLSRAEYAEQRRRSYTLRLWKNVTRNTDISADYDLIDTRHFGTPFGNTSHRIYLSSFSQLSTTTTLAMRGDSNWYYADIGDGSQTLFRSMSLGSVFITHLTPDDEVLASQHSTAAWADQSSNVGNDVQAIYSHRFAPWLRGRSGAEFGHFATDATALGFGYQKYREAALGGAEMRVPVSILEFSPTYLAAVGLVQLDYGGGGSYVRHDAALPVAVGLEGTPLVVAGFLRHERDTSDVRVFRRYRALNARLDVLGVGVDPGGDLTRAWLEGTRSRTDGVLDVWRTREDETRGGVNTDTRLGRLNSRFGAGYAYALRISLEQELRTHFVSVTWDFWPASGMQLANTVEFSRTLSPGLADVDRVLCFSNATYRWRAMEFTGSFRYDDVLDSTDDDNWGAYVFARRYFGSGS